MTKIDIAYNPYKLTTSIYVNGKIPKQNSSLNVENRRLQEWVDKLPDILLDEFPDNNYDIQFTGTQVDYDDLTSSFSANQDINVKFNFVKKGDAETVEKAIDEIFLEIEKGPVAEMRDKKIKEAFEKAKNQQFEINVIATMSAGKSTLINALLERKLMPIGNQATTATIVKILDKKGQKEFSAKAFDQNHKLVKQFTDITYQDMVSLNSDANVSTIEIQGDIPFVRSIGMRLVLIDTPGPNNSRDKQHEIMTYRMLENSDKSLVLFVINGRQVGIKDEQDVLGFVCETMDKGGKQSRERYIFAANQMDAYDIDDEGIGCVEKALNDEKEILEGKGIINPNIFPVASRPALEVRTQDPKRMTLNAFENNVAGSDVYHFEKYYHFSHLPQKAKTDVEIWLNNADEREKIEIHTGIVSIEQAINQYVNKYARTTKVNDLVQSFNHRLKEIAMVENVQKAIRDDKRKKEELKKQIDQILEKIKMAENAMDISTRIDQIDIMDKVNKEVVEKMKDIRQQINLIIIRHDQKIEKSEISKARCELEKQCKTLPSKISVQIEDILKNSYKELYQNIIDEYKRYLNELNMNIDASSLLFNPGAFVMDKLKDLSSVIDDNTHTSYETKDKVVEYEVTVSGTRGRRAAGGAAGGAATGAAIGSFIPGLGTLLGGLIGGAIGAIGGAASGEDEHKEKRTRIEQVQVKKQEVYMKQVAQDYLQPLLNNIGNIQKLVVTHVNNETQRIKGVLKEELGKINNLLIQKTSDLKKKMSETTAKEEDIKRNESNLKWIESIQNRIDQLIEF